MVTALRDRNLPFDGLVCPRARGEVGVRVAVDVDPTSAQQDYKIGAQLLGYGVWSTGQGTPGRTPHFLTRY